MPPRRSEISPACGTTKAPARRNPLLPDNLDSTYDSRGRKARFDAESPGYGPRRTHHGNDPDSVMRSHRLPQNHVSEHAIRIRSGSRPHHPSSSSTSTSTATIWIYGRRSCGRRSRPPGSATPSAAGKVMTRWLSNPAGFSDNTWLGSTGYPHSEDMRVNERYRRVDHDTIHLRHHDHRPEGLHEVPSSVLTALSGGARAMKWLKKSVCLPKKIFCR